MDKTFEEIIGETLQEDFNIDVQNTNDDDTPDDLESAPESEEDVDVIESDDEDDELDDELPEDLEGSEEVTNPGINEKDAQAFARMRTELKQANNDLAAAREIVDFFDVRAKQMGLDGIQGLMDKTKEAELAKQAEEKGVPVDVLKRIDELENKVKQQDEEREMLQRNQKEQSINHTFETFMQKHPLTQEATAKLAKDLIADGFSFEGLMDMPASAVERILSSYLPNEAVKQEMIAKKEKVKKELPATGNTSSKFNTEDQIDKIAKMWAGI